MHETQSTRTGKGFVGHVTKWYDRDLGSDQERVLGHVFPYCKILGAKEGDF